MISRGLSMALGGDLEIRTQLTVSLCRAVCTRSSGFTRYGKVTDAHSVEAWVTLGRWVMGVLCMETMSGDYVFVLMAYLWI